MENTAIFEELKQRLDNLREGFDGTKKRTSEETASAEAIAKANVLSGFLFELSELEEMNLAFKPKHWNAIIDHATVHRNGNMTFSFANGSEVCV